MLSVPLFVFSLVHLGPIRTDLNATSAITDHKRLAKA